MSLFILQENVQKYIENENKAKVTFSMQIYFQNQPNVIFVSKSRNALQYFVVIQTKRLQKVQVVLECQIEQNYVKLKFKPILLLGFNRQLSARSQRCIIELNNKLKNKGNSHKNHFYKWYINKNGQLQIQIAYQLEQFLSPIHVQFILNKTLKQIRQILEDKISVMLSYLNIENSRFTFQEPKTENEDEEHLSHFDKLKYMILLNQVYKNHRNVYLQQEQTQTTQNEAEYFGSNIQNFSKANTLAQEDISLVQILERQKVNFQIRLKQALRLLNPIIDDKKGHLNMYKMYLTQKQFQNHVKAVKKKNLQIYDINNSHYRIVRGIKNHVSISKQRMISEEGSHSNIFVGTYSLHLAQTLFTYTNDANKQEGEKKAVIKPLICKRIKDVKQQASVNSFKNELDFLFYVKDKRSKFIASYFLPMDRSKYQSCEIFAEYYEKNLKEYLEDQKNKNIQISLNQILQFAENILLSLIFMVENTILHRDLKPFNIMVDKKLKTKVIDFGSCCSIFYRTDFEVAEKRMLTTPAYQIRYKDCPESTRVKYSKQQFEQHILFDVYSYGVILDQMVQYLDLTIFMNQKSSINIKQVIQMVAAKCKQPDPIDRLTFDELLFYIKLLKQIAIQE